MLLRNKKCLTLLLVISAIGAIFASISILMSKPNLMTVILNITAILFLLGFTIPIFFNVDVFKLAKLRTYSDHLTIVFAILLHTVDLQNYYFYIALVWIQSFFNIYCLLIDSKLRWFLKIVPTLICLYAIYFLWGQTLPLFLFISGTSMSVLISYSIEILTIKQKEFEKTFTAVKEVQQSIIIHNIRNQVNTLVLQVTKDYHELEKLILQTFSQIITSVDSMSNSSKVKTDIFILVNRMASYFKLKNEIDIEMSLKRMPVLIYDQLFLSVLYVFFSNSCEAGSNKITVIKDGNNLIITDNGCGFDTSKIKKGFSTKQYGHGLGLIYSIDACKTNNIDVKINSRIGIGTTISLDLSKVIEN
jgi:signal transduction histidine kinase